METDLKEWRGLSGRFYEFWVFELGKSFGQFGAVFLYTKQLKANDFEMVYINQTDRMDQVVANPIADYIVKTFEPDSMQIFKCGDLDDRKFIMSDLIVKFNPQGNRGTS